MMTRNPFLTALGAMALAGATLACETDTFEPVDQGPCTQTFECPVDYVCVAERCVLGDDSGAADAGSDAGSGEGSGT